MVGGEHTDQLDEVRNQCLPARPTGTQARAGAAVRGTTVIASVLTGLLLASCGDTRLPGPGVLSSEQTTPSASHYDKRPATDAEVLVTADWTDALPVASPYPSTLPTIALRYTVRNDGPELLLVASERGHDQSPTSTAPQSPLTVWVSQGPEDDLARLSKQVFDAPPGIDLAVPWRAPAELVDVGIEMEGYVVLPVPLRGDLPQASAGLTLTEDVLAGTPARVELCLQVVPFTDGMAPDEITMGISGRLVCSEPLQLPEDDR